MRIPDPDRLNPAEARRAIAAGKSNKPFVAALLDRDHPDHRPAVDKWFRLHQAAYPEPGREPEGRSPDPRRRPPIGGAGQSASGRVTSVGRSGVDAAPGSSGATRIGRDGRGRDGEGLPGAPQEPQGRGTGPSSTSQSQRLRRGILPDPSRPLDVDPSALASLRRREGEREEDWVGRLRAETARPDTGLDWLLLIREAILREIGYYELGSGPVPDGWIMSKSDWETLAALQNVSPKGWRGAEQYSPAERATFERIGELPMFGVVGPDGNIYHRLTIKGSNPIGHQLQAINGFIRSTEQQPPDIDAALAMMAMGVVSLGGRGGVAPRAPLLAAAVPRAMRFIRAQRNAAALGLAAGVGAGLAGDAARRESGRSDMDAAPDLPPAPGFEPPQRPENDESFGDESIEVGVVPGLEFPELDGPKVLIFPDISDEIEQILIIERRERQETRDQIDAIRDYIAGRWPEWKHVGGGRQGEDDLREYRVPGPGAAFRHPVTGRPGDGRPGSIFVDLTFEMSNGRHVHIQTVDIDRDGSPTERELKAARRLAEVTGEPVYLIPKIWQLRQLR